MKTVILLRHAKSSWDNPASSDFQRPLNSRGIRDAPRIGAWIAEQGIKPDWVLCSAATRAQETLARLQTTLDLGVNITITDHLYLAPPTTVVELLSQADDSAKCSLVIAHNPGMEGLLWGLCGTDNSMPTCALAVIELPIDSWLATDLNCQGTLQHYITPRELPNSR
ncbi:MAG: histidine phosphatase family protein [Planctomycetaceae bacterium]|jgi:phosphohistidine phosphatase|nr:histidine phosphatase family protein [Planctomycetaceae bacterium]MBT4010955.1 histidine phosphatase family protein [Planctomycetaceae bacterium]MBT4726466.1 histidine phosphatase family protein [Planctomycetaceae bacterium]MBT5125371.1 histidine phosphatase family protein [Planctomycetaceae bacterium]MBT5600448.1 histidine phosphatase family protein [Planctomycetaceae bacterium]